VEKLAEKYKLIYKKTDFDTVRFAKSNKISIEMAAREMRYAWFKKLAPENKCQTIATAHHTDDSIETLLLNMIRGTGLKGLTGIEPRNGDIVRPVLCCTRSEIEQYAQKNKLEYITDSTNLANEYSRNKIRNLILPMMADINPSVKQSLAENISRFRGSWKIYSEKIAEIEAHITFNKENQTFVDIDKLKSQSDPKTVLFEILQKYQFNSDVISNIFEGLDKSSGKRYYSDTHRLLKDREHLIVDEIEPNNTLEFSIDESTKLISIPINLSLNKKARNEDFIISKKSDKIHIDADKIKFPLTLRKWKKGDSFHPFGMKESKKLSDFFINEKINRNQKENIWLLVSDNKIVWIIGLRMDERFRITEKTKNILEISLYQ
jgi:tRNA(Ile)-lysidine synthase